MKESTSKIVLVVLAVMYAIIALAVPIGSLGGKYEVSVADVLEAMDGFSINWATCYLLIPVISALISLYSSRTGRIWASVLMFLPSIVLLFEIEFGDRGDLEAGFFLTLCIAIGMLIVALKEEEDGEESEDGTGRSANGKSAAINKMEGEVKDYPLEKINEILANDTIYDVSLIDACRQELQLRIGAEEFMEFVESKTDDELEEILKNRSRYNQAMVRCSDEVMKRRKAEAAEQERVRLEEEERRRREEEEAQRIEKERRRAEHWKKWRIPYFILLAVIVASVTGYIIHLNVKEKARQEQIRIEEEHARAVEAKRLEAEMLAAEERAEAERLEKERIAKSKAAEAERLKEERRIAEEKAEAERLEKERVAAEERAARLAEEEKKREDWEQQILAKHKSGKYSIGEPMPEITGYATVPVIFNIGSNYIECFVVIDDKCSLKDARAHLAKCPTSLQAKAIGLKIATINANLMKLGYKTIGNSYWLNLSSQNDKSAYAYDSRTQKVLPFNEDNAINTCLQVIKYNK